MQHESMEVLTTDYGNFHVATPTELSPTQSPLSTSPSPEQCHSPRGASLEQSLHIIVEPQLDGQTNFIHLMNPPTGQILSSYIAEHGAIIEITPGVFFRVPFPHEHGYPYPTVAPQMQPQHAPYHTHYNNCLPTHSVTENTLPNNVLIPTQQFNPSCPIHGSPISGTDSHYTGDERLNKRREKLQKKLRQKQNHIKCTCFKLDSENLAEYQQKKGEHATDEKWFTRINGKAGSENGTNETEEDITLCAPPKAQVLSPYAVVLSWEESVTNKDHLSLCQFNLQISTKENNYQTIYCGQETSFTCPKLQPGTEYIFRLCALLNGRSGPFSETVSCTTLCTVPDKPLPPRIAQKTKSSLTLKWTTPADGGSHITYYKLQWTKNNDYQHFDDLFVGLQKQFKHIHKLPPGTPCLYRLQAANEYGPSEYSEIFECLTSAGPPAPPTKPIIQECGINYIRLNWNEPDNNGSPIEKYKLEMENPSDGYGFIAQHCDLQRSYCCVNLRRNTSYKFRVLATNSQGSSKYSPIAEISTLPEAPGKMDKPKVNGKIKTHCIPVKWDPPKDTGGDQIVGYILECDDGKGGNSVKVYHGSDREVVVDQRLPGHTYKLRVASESKVGIGPWSPIANMTTLPVCPKDCQPPKLSSQLKLDTTVLNLVWDQPLDLGGAPINNYVVKMAKSAQEEFHQIYSGTNRNCRVIDLKPGTDYHFKLQASNSAGASPWSLISTLKTAPGPPDSPLPPLVSFKSPTHIRFDWNEPMLHGTEVTGYCIEKLENETFHKVYQGACLYCEIKKNLEPASHHFFRLQAMSAVGNSAFSNVFTVETPPAPPSAVTSIKVIEQTSNSCLIQWRHPVENGSAVYEYVLEATGATSLVCTVQRPKPSPPALNTSKEPMKSIEDKNLDESSDDDSDVEDSDDEAVGSYTESETSSSTASRVIDDDAMEYRLTGLTADASYKLRLQAINSCGSGPFSYGIQFYTKELPPAPPSLSSSTISYHSLKLKWGGDSNSKKSLAVLSHTLQMQNKTGSFTSIYSGIGTSFTLSKLKELTPYCCRIRSKNDAGEGEFSKPKVFYTKAQPPSVIKDLKSKDVTQSSISLSWSPCDKIRQDDVIEYALQRVNSEKNKDFTEIYRGSKTTFTVIELQNDQIYQFRVHTIRILSEEARQCAPGVVEEMKGVFCPLTRVRTLSEDITEESVDDVIDNTQADRGCQSRRLTDTHIALIILGSFLGLCLLIAVILRGVMGEEES